MSDKYEKMQSLASPWVRAVGGLTRPICQVYRLLPDDSAEKNMVREGLLEISRRTERPRDDVSADGKKALFPTKEILAIGHLVLGLATDIQEWYRDAPAHASLILDLEEGKGRLALLLSEIREACKK